MRHSSLRLVIFSVLTGWLLGFVVLIFYGRSQSWTEDKVRRDGVFLVYELLEQVPRLNRPRRLRVLQKHFSVKLTLISLDDLKSRIGRPGTLGEPIPYRMSIREAWYFIVFKDGSGALAAGPVNPVRPSGVVPVGILLLIVLLPVIAGIVAFQLGRGILKVERANQALAVGDLSVRIEDDKSSSKELVTSFNVMAERVEVLIRNRDELIQAVSHELGSPLSRLRFHVELLENLSEPKRSERIQAMALELDALDDLVAELLNCAQQDELELNLQLFEPEQGLADLAELLSHEALEQRRVNIELKIADGITVFADQRLFLRAIENLLRNAVRYAKSKVLLELSKEAEQVCICVHDDGPGIPEDLREKVMLPFFRLEAERSRKMGGLGLGLAIVDRIIKRHGGDIVIASSPLGGAKLTSFWSSSAQ